MSAFRSYLPYLVVWTAANLLQAAFTGLLHDEAYYWVYAQNMAWGYFDHPPVIAACIRAGTFIFNGELGVRLLPVLLSTATMGILFHWVRPASHALFFLFMCSITIVHMGFIAAPDVPLITIACLFMVAFQRYARNDNWKNALLLAVVCAALMYTKYHGALLILIACLSQWHLLRRRTFWMMTAVALLLYVPHLGWLVEHDLVTIRYHLFERAGKGFAWQFPVEYVLGQLAIYGPLAGLLMIVTFRQWAQHGMARTARWIVIGVFGLFFISAFRGRVEANWTTIALPALVYLTYRVIEGRAPYERWLRIIAAITIPLVIVLRLLFVIDLTRVSKLEEVHGWETWAVEISEAAGERIPVFRNSYQYASKYMFYAGHPSFSCNDAAYKGNQFDLLHHYEQAILGQPVLFLSGVRADSVWDATLAPLETETGPLQQRRFAAFACYNRLNVRLLDPPESCVAGDEITLGLQIENPTGLPVAIDTANATIAVCFMQNGVDAEVWLAAPCPIETVVPGQSVKASVRLRMALSPGAYRYRVGIRWKETGGKNGFQHRLEVKPGQ